MNCELCGRPKFEPGYGCEPDSDECAADCSIDETCTIAAAAYQRGLAEAKWRAIPDGVAEDTRRCVLVYTPNGIHPRSEVAYWGAWAYWSAKPTHYMELPSPPEVV